MEYDYNSAFDLNYLFYFSIAYMAAVFIFVFKFEKRKHFWIPLILCIAGVLVFGYFFPYTFVYGFPLGTIIVGVMIYVGMLLTFRETPGTLFVAMMMGVVANHACFSLWSIILINTPLFQSDNPYNDYIQLFSGIAYFGLALTGIYFVFARRIASADNLSMKKLRQKISLAVFALAIIVLPSLCRLFEMESIFTRVYECLACLVYLFVELYINFQNESEVEKAKIETLLASEEKQRAISEKSAEILSIKAHDLKHQLNLLRQNDSSSFEQIREMEEAISQYDMLTNTGNKAFDAVVAEKAQAMRKHQIKFTCIVDPDAINFMSPGDVYSFFGNALTNAYEACRQVNDKQSRYIAMKVRKNGNMCSVHVENYTNVIPNFKKGMPLTSKKDAEAHGFGTKSMSYIAQKYGGHLTLREKDNIFTVDAIFFME